ncbi:DBH-like monooxygenase protein 2 homolog [Watersipora subatra]|uniref:DBH-like monooxygenase protein 2 homolog n=1 Tax=Watersipora subatra TaxID=2589382 RepID=UPI00355C7F17
MSRQSSPAFRAALIVVYLSFCYGYNIYEDSIPNGASVPHPCKPNYIWKGVGHENVLGGGVRNPFGVHFQEAGKQWTVDLCNADSDGDGKSNGEELGDPNCVWVSGVAERTLGLSHPGICEPTDSDLCLQMNSWEIDCSIADFTCHGLGEPDTQNVTIKFDRTPVPAQETTYMCQTFDIPNDQVYHLFASQPVIDNPYVMHHTLVFGCTDTPPSEYASPAPCGMSTRACRVLIAGWTVGSPGRCLGSTDGFLVGKGHFSQVMMEHHWNNPTEETNYFDASGITLFLTRNLRENSLGTFITGQRSLTIPPGEDSFTVNGVCTKDCLQQKLENTLYITSATLHMHYLGSSGRVEHWRDGVLINTWFDASEYSYDSPVTNVFDPPIPLMEGDEIKTICTYKTTSKDEITYYGDATSDEMCFAFMNYFPSERGPDECVAFDDISSCDRFSSANSFSASVYLFINLLCLRFI